MHASECRRASAFHGLIRLGTLFAQTLTTAQYRTRGGSAVGQAASNLIDHKITDCLNILDNVLQGYVGEINVSEPRLKQRLHIRVQGGCIASNRPYVRMEGYPLGGALHTRNRASVSAPSVIKSTDTGARE